MDLPSVDWWPGGAWGTFWLFMLPIGPVKPAGILAGKNAGLDAFALLGLYLAKDVATSLYLDPLLRLGGRIGSRYPWSRTVAEQIAAIVARLQITPGRWGQMGSLALIGLGAGFMTGAVALANTPISPPLGWLGVILGDVVWFSLLLAAALGLSSVMPDDRLVFAGVVVLALIGQPLARHLSTWAKERPGG